MHPCPCGTGKTYIKCCGAFISGFKLPGTPEELMRSRYTAYTQANIDYIADTMKMPASKNFDAKTAYQWAISVIWKKLEIIKSSIDKTQGFVEFIAYFDEQCVKKTIHELSEFHQENGKWYYIDGKSYTQKPYLSQSQVGRNDLCPCGSGRKYKKCCL